MVSACASPAPRLARPRRAAASAERRPDPPPRSLPTATQAENEVDPAVLEMMKAGGYFYKHDFGRAKRSRKQLKLSSDGLKLTWKSVGANEGDGTDRGGSPSVRGVMRSASFSRTTSSA